MSTAQTGKLYETKAIKYLRDLKYEILQRNYKTKYGEIDIIAYDKKEKSLVFIEVRYRKNIYFGTPQETIIATKQKRIILSAMYYLKLNKKNYDSIRFDVISFTNEDSIEHIKNAFQLNIYQKYFI
ncbi:MAG: YraN family protein [Endomicrobia bacterium]|nr:YraN family protein [Endomicrobiia bacterium]